MKRVEGTTDSDESGYTPQYNKLHTLWRHLKTGHEYVITGFGLNAKTGLWEYEYKQVDGSNPLTGYVTYHREPREWHEILANGKARFVRIFYSGGPEVGI